LPPLIRDRVDADLDACLSALALVHAADGYPMAWPLDPLRWLRPRDLRRAWVGVGDGQDAIAGHVTVVAGPSRPDGVAEVARLFVTPPYRRSGLAGQLLARCLEWAAVSGLTPELEVAAVGDRTTAMALYEATGWRRTGTSLATWTAPDGAAVHLHRYRKDP
jgi:GNAT superfamily N-acetyltransferase